MKGGEKMSFFEKALGIQPRIQICACTTTRTVCNFPSFYTCDPLYAGPGFEYKVQVDCTTGEECSNRQPTGNCCK
ncbi:hypothetical protein D3C73_1596340 [compost metagenome]